MCGIFCCISHQSEEQLKQGIGCSETTDCKDCSDNNQRRGPDDPSPSYFNTAINDKWSAAFRGWVLWTQGASMTPQPLREAGNVLLWNGDIFSGPLEQTSISDTQALYSALQETKNVVQTLSLIEGPYSFIYYQKSSQFLYFGRDFIGRHSLLMKIIPEQKSLIISSVASGNLDNYIEVPALGIFMIDLKKDYLNLTLFPWRDSPEAIDRLKERLSMDIDVRDPILSTERNKIISEPLLDDLLYVNLISDIKNIGEAMQRFLEDPDISKRAGEILKRLRESVRIRVKTKPDYCRDCIKLNGGRGNINCYHPKVGLLFSGGLDSTILAAIAHEFIPENESIDLINVAFEKAKRENKSAVIVKRKNDNIAQGDDKITFEVPDRKTGRQAWEELKIIFPNRQWNFVEVIA